MNDVDVDVAHSIVCALLLPVAPGIYARVVCIRVRVRVCVVMMAIF